MKNLVNFEKIQTEENETLKAYFDLNGQKVYAAFNSPERIKLYENNGDLSCLSQEELFAVLGKHCSTTLRKAICEILSLEESDVVYQGYVNVTAIYEGTDGNTYINTSERSNQHGSRFYMTLKVPSGQERCISSQIDARIIKSWEVMASTDSPYKRPLKTFRKKITQ